MPVGQAPEEQEPVSQALPVDPFTEGLKVESMRSVFFDPHFGQVGAVASDVDCNSSKTCAHFVQRYSNKGMVFPPLKTSDFSSLSYRKEKKENVQKRLFFDVFLQISEFT